MSSCCGFFVGHASSRARWFQNRTPGVPTFDLKEGRLVKAFPTFWFRLEDLSIFPGLPVFALLCSWRLLTCKHLIGGVKIFVCIDLCPVKPR